MAKADSAPNARGHREKAISNGSIAVIQKLFPEATLRQWEGNIELCISSRVNPLTGVTVIASCEEFSALHC